MSLGMPNFMVLPFGVFAPHICDFPYHGTQRFFGFLQLATAYTPKRIFTKNTPKDIVPAKDVPFGGPDNYI